ncbi:Lrp/AsnC family transcriptional regulator [Paucibacter sp. O1-1]|uniref:Lrp/AsnC family transcriptional regulator n=1 Tax=Paucibacter sp. PLA-PC-4 TaxID=2993655 RepID=UPI0010F4751B|nr:Lrp/AsnC family transcriptional regulator [Paucibacter sp. PLA-PC-4]MCU7374498.1 Lrp/AsnC family transcriptional regulator [Paucibacter sp. O1-1]MCX2864342.1 Lrp/AsnC family transcriptional regulator [Paucibacter sp. PLA-PC-4]MDA3829500.1 Lrp/AsnC family transcriptional regulator [Paucibacter sp. O1-1]
MQVEIDATDRLLLQALQANARLTTSELAQQTQLSQSPCWRRIKRLEDAGLIAGYHARLDRRALGYGVMAFVTISIEGQDEGHSLDFERAVRDIPEVVMCHGVSGPEDFVLVVVAQDLDAYSALMQHKLRRLPGVKMVRTSFSLQEVKGLDGLPIPA